MLQYLFSKIGLASDPANSRAGEIVASYPALALLARKEGLVLIACACTPFNESLGLATLSINIPSIYDVYNYYFGRF